MAALARLNRSYALAAPGANTNAITPVTPHDTSSMLRVTVVLAVASVFNVQTTDGTTAYTWGLNGSVPLNAGDLYVFEFPCSSLQTYSFRVETDGIIQTLLVDEIRGAV